MSKQANTKIFSQYIELPSQLMEGIKSVIMPDKPYDIDSTLMHLYSLMMNHQDNSRKNNNAYYAESYVSLAYLTHSSKATIERKTKQLIQMGLLSQVYRHKDTSIWVVYPLSHLKEDKIIRRKSRKEEMKEAIQLKLNNLEFQNETQTDQNGTHAHQNETQTDQNDALNNSIIISSITSPLAVNQDTEIESDNIGIPDNKPHSKNNDLSQCTNKQSITQCLTDRSEILSQCFTSSDSAYQYLVDNGCIVDRSTFNTTFNIRGNYVCPDTGLYVRRSYS